MRAAAARAMHVDLKKGEVREEGGRISVFGGQSGKVSAGWPYQTALSCPVTSG